MAKQRRDGLEQVVREGGIARVFARLCRHRREPFQARLRRGFDADAEEAARRLLRADERQALLTWRSPASANDRAVPSTTTSDMGSMLHKGRGGEGAKKYALRFHLCGGAKLYSFTFHSTQPAAAIRHREQTYNKLIKKERVCKI